MLILIYIARLIRFAGLSALPCDETAGYGLTRRGIGHHLHRRVARGCMWPDLSPDGILYPGCSGGHPQSKYCSSTAGIVTLCTLHQCHHHARTAEPLGTDSRTFCTHHVGYRIEKSIRENSEKYLEGLKRDALRRGANWHKVEATVTAQPGKAKKSTKQNHAAGNPSACYWIREKCPSAGNL